MILSVSAWRPSDRRQWLVYLCVCLSGYVIGCLSPGAVKQAVVQMLPGRMLVVEKEAVEVEDTINLHKEKPGEEEGKEEDDEAVDLAVIVCVVLLLILLTIAFEVSKEYLEEKANRNMRPIVDKLFGEMTVLGFLSIFTFVITKAGYFSDISRLVFGDDSELLEIFEFVHFTIFFVMVFFVMQVLILVREAMETEDTWMSFEKAARDPAMAEMWGLRAQSFYQDGINHRRKSFQAARDLTVLLPMFRHPKRQLREDQIMFKALRDEFILERSSDYPFKPAPENRRVNKDFNFARYLSMSLGNLLSQVVEVNIVTWFTFAILTVIYYFYCVLVQENLTILSWSWVAMGWFVFGYNVYFEQHLIQLRKVFATKDIFLLAQENGMDDEKFANETTYLKELEEHHNDGTNSLPAWCHVDLDKYIENRHWLVKWMVPGTPNRQQTLYWLDRKGPKFYMIVLQANLIFIGLYTAMNLLGFLKFMYHSQHPVTFIAYLVLSILPMIGVMFFKKHLVAILSQVCCMGAYRRPNIVADVLREEKTARVVRAFIIIYKLRRFAEQAGSKKRDKGAGQLYRAQFDQLELQEVGKTFDSFDRSGDGSISYDEFELLMTQLGASMSPDSLQRMIAMLDEDGDGEVSKNEFINWYAEYAGEEDMSPHERAKYLFSLFDSQGTGELTIGEFKRKLDALNVGFTVDDVGALVNELDEDNSGSIGLHEFEDLLNKYYPKELKQQQSTSSSVHESRSFH